MNPLLIEVRCILGQGDPQWASISTLTLEIGYPGRNGQTLWKHIGWLPNQITTTGRDFAQAFWNHTVADRVLVFDFLPVTGVKTHKTEMAYRIRKSIMAADGKQRTSSRLLRGDYQDEHFTVLATYPDSQ